jgi:hypothetical protein
MGKMQAPVPPEHLRAIGQVTVNFAILESVISFFIGRMISTDQMLGNLVGLLSSIYKYKVNDKGRVAELERLLNRALYAEEQRNIVTHSSWAVGDKAETITRFKATAKKVKGLTHQFEQMTVEDLDRIADLAGDVAAEIQLFMFNLHDSKSKG